MYIYGGVITGDRLILWTREQGRGKKAETVRDGVEVKVSTGITTAHLRLKADGRGRVTIWRNGVPRTKHIGPEESLICRIRRRLRGE